MEFEWDPEKARTNFIKHGVSFESIFEFEWKNHLRAVDRRMDYGEERVQALGMIGGRVHILVYTMNDDNIRIISLRKANSREVMIHERHLKNRASSGF